VDCITGDFEPPRDSCWGLPVFLQDNQNLLFPPGQLPGRFPRPSCWGRCRGSCQLVVKFIGQFNVIQCDSLVKLDQACNLLLVHHGSFPFVLKLDEQPYQGDK
jgi:hypothetical protein